MRTVASQRRRGRPGVRTASAPMQHARRLVLLAAAAFALALVVDVLAFGPASTHGTRGSAGSDDAPATSALPGGDSWHGLDAASEEVPGTAEPSGEMTASSEADSLLTLLAATEPANGNSRATAVLTAEVPDAALALLDAYHTGPTCMLAHEGYLDLSGNAWGCVVQGEGWVDVAVVQTHAEGESQVSVTRLHVDEWTEDLEGVVPDEG